MTTEEFISFHKKTCDRIHHKMISQDIKRYGKTDDPFPHIRTTEAACVASGMQSFLIKMLERITIVNAFAQQGPSVVEQKNIEETLLDLANDAISMAAFIKSESEIQTEMVWGQSNIRVGSPVRELGNDQGSAPSIKT